MLQRKYVIMMILIVIVAMIIIQQEQQYTSSCIHVFGFVIQTTTKLPVTSSLVTISHSKHRYHNSNSRISRSSYNNINNNEMTLTENTHQLSTNATRTKLNDPNVSEAQRLLDRVKQMRMEIASLTGQTLEDVELEASNKKQLQQQVQQNRTISRLQSKVAAQQQQQKKQYIIPVPETIDEQILQAKMAIERAYQDGYNKQIIRFALLPFNNNNNQNDNSNVMFINNEQDWPGGIQQIYREATRPYTISLLQQLRINHHHHNNPSSNIPTWSMNNKYKPIIEEQVLWDFDGSALLTARTNITDTTTSTEPMTTTSTMNIQALVHPNTDNRYFDDITSMNHNLQQILHHNSSSNSYGLNIIINPFWTDISSWGYNIFAPNAKQRAQSIIYNTNDVNQNGTNTDGYHEIYNILIKTIRGEDCIAIKSYPYDWQLYAYIENYDTYSPSSSYISTVHLGSTNHTPTISDFVSYMNQRTEFQYSKNMRQLQRYNNNKK